ncbi:hypothetical protein VTN96DRAFT_8339 [Rasamsonia emersonii]
MASLFFESSHELRDRALVIRRNLYEPTIRAQQFLHGVIFCGQPQRENMELRKSTGNTLQASKPSWVRQPLPNISFRYRPIQIDATVEDTEYWKKLNVITKEDMFSASLAFPRGSTFIYDDREKLLIMALLEHL